MRSSTRPEFETGRSLPACATGPIGSRSLDRERQSGSRPGAPKNRSPSGATTGRASRERRCEIVACGSTRSFSGADRLPLCRRLRCRSAATLDPQGAPRRTGSSRTPAGSLRRSFNASIGPAACRRSAITPSSHPWAWAMPRSATGIGSLAAKAAVQSFRDPSAWNEKYVTAPYPLGVRPQVSRLLSLSVIIAMRYYSDCKAIQGTEHRTPLQRPFCSPPSARYPAPCPHETSARGGGKRAIGLEASSFPSPRSSTRQQEGSTQHPHQRPMARML